jgi:hypothetical protein
MPLYVVNTQMDNLDIDAFVLPYYSSLENYYMHNNYKNYALLEFLEKAQDNNINEENLSKKNQVVYFIKNSKDEIPAILTSCNLPEFDRSQLFEDSDEADESTKSAHEEENRIISNYYFEEEKKALAAFYKKILKTALYYNFYNISIPIIISDIVDSYQYIDFARKVVRNFINNSFDELTVYLQLTDYDNDYFTDEERSQYKFRKVLEDNVCSHYYNFWAEQNRKRHKNDELVCLNQDQYSNYKWFGNGSYHAVFDFEGQIKKKQKREKEKSEWEKLKKQSRSKSIDNESIEKLINERLKIRDESFSEMVMRKIEEKGLSPVSCYKSANVDRNIFSKITKDAKKDETKDGERFIYRPEKKIALAFAIALHLKQTEAEELLSKAGFSFRNSALDIIVKVFIEKGIYDIDLINQQLLKYDQPLLGTTTRDS